MFREFFVVYKFVTNIRKFEINISWNYTLGIRCRLVVIGKQNPNSFAEFFAREMATGTALD